MKISPAKPSRIKTLSAHLKDKAHQDAHVLKYVIMGISKKNYTIVSY